jgi:hypothetical protein
MSETPRLRRWLVATALLWMAVINGVLLWNTRAPIRQGYGDFASFYTAGTLVRRGLGAEIYNPAAQWKVQQEFAAEVQTRRGPLCYMRPPFEALLFSVFATWPYATALLLWTVVKLALLAAIPFVVVPGGFWKERFPRWATVVLVLGTFPEFMDLLMGQDAALLAFLFAISFWQLATDRDAGAGFTLGLALFKFQLVIPFVVMLWIGGRKRVLPGFATSAFAVLAISAVVVGWRGLLKYPGYLLALNQATGVGIVPESQINLRGLFALVVGRLSSPDRIYWVLAPVALGAIVYTGLIWRKAGGRSSSLAEGFGLASIVALVTSYYTNDYDLLLLIVPLLAMRARPDDTAKPDRVTRNLTRNLTRYLEATGLLLLLLTPVYWFARVELQAECLMMLPLLAVGVALARRLRGAGVRVSAERRAPVLDGPR